MSYRQPGFKEHTSCITARRIIASVGKSPIICERLLAYRLLVGKRLDIREIRIQAYRAVIQALIYHTDFGSGPSLFEVFASAERLADEANVDKRTFYRVIEELHLVGWLEKVTEYDHTHQHHKAMRIFVMPEMFRRFGFNRDEVKQAVQGMKKYRRSASDDPNAIREETINSVRKRLAQIKPKQAKRIESARDFILKGRAAAPTHSPKGPEIKQQGSDQVAPPLSEFQKELAALAKTFRENGMSALLASQKALQQLKGQDPPS